MPEDGETRLSAPTPVPPGGEAAGPLNIGEPFGTRYRILRVLGAGGMGVVYHAWDEALGVAVALKVIRPEVMADPTTAREVEKRFKRELLLARQVTHRNVVRIHDLGELNGIKYLTMPFVEGQDLARIIRESGRLPVARALAIAREIAAGLTAAHEAGVVHRDLKPENIMVDGEQHAEIMDFGISRSSRAAALAARPRAHGGFSAGLEDANVMAGMTMAGAVVGTVQYMAPEQARGGEVDHRADIYAFGLIFRDMLVGSRQHAGQSALDEMMARIQAVPAGPREVDEQIPETLDRIIRRCLEPDPAARYQSTQELIAELDRLDAEGGLLPEPKRLTRRLVIGSLAAVIALLAGTWWLAQTPPAEVQPPNMSVLIADFENRTNDPVFEGALEQALGIEIEGAPFIHAYPRRDAMRIGAQIDAIDAGGRLTERAARLVSVREGIQVILAGSVVPSGSGYEIVVKAIDLGADRPISTVSAKASDKPGVLKAVGAVAKNLRRDLGDVTLEDSGAGGREMLTTASLEAVREFAVGLDLQRAYKDEEAIEHYKRAVSLDANFGRAYSGWGNAASRLGREDESREAWAKALALVDRMSEREKYRTLGLYYGTVTRNYPKALESYENLVKLFPADGAGHNNLALAYFNTLNFKQALESGKRARDIYPQNLLYQGNYALYAMYAGDFATAAAEAQRVVKSQAEYYPAYLPQAIAALANGDLAAAREVYGRMASTGTPGASIASLGVADLAAYSGRFAEAVDRLKQGVAEDEKTGNRSARGVKLAALAEIHADMGDLRRAARFAREAVSVTRQPGVVVASARVLARARQSAAVGPLVSGLERDLQPHPRAYAQIIQGEIAARNGRTIEAVEAFQSGRKLADLWLGRLQLGIAYVEAGHYAEGLSELDEALKRQGEATALFLDDMPTFRYLADLPYWVARAHAGLGAQEPAIREFRRFLDTRGANRRAPYVADAGRRLAALSQTR